MRRKYRTLLSVLLMFSILLTSKNVCEVMAVEKDEEQDHKVTMEIAGGRGLIVLLAGEKEYTLASGEEDRIKELSFKKGTKLQIKMKAEEDFKLKEYTVCYGNETKEEKENPDTESIELLVEDEDIRISAVFERSEPGQTEERLGEQIEEHADESTDIDEEKIKERTPIYDVESLDRILDSISGMKPLSQKDNIMTYASAGQTVNASVLRTDIGTISMIRYTDTGWENVQEWSEGLLGLSNGEWVYCADPNVTFQSGTKQCYDAGNFYSEETIKTIGMMLYYFDTYVKCGGMSEADVYLIKQCVVWSVLNHVNGWLSGIALEYGNGMNDTLGHSLASHLGNAVYEGASWAADEENRKDFRCSGVIMKGNGQDLSQWSYEYNPKGKLCIQKSSANMEVTGNNGCYSLAEAEYGVYADQACKNLVVTLKTDAEGKSNTVELSKGTYYLKEIKAPKGFAVDTRVKDVTVVTGQTNQVKLTDKPQMNQVDIVLEKRDKDTNTSKASGAASLKNAEFTVKYYSGYYDTASALQGKMPMRSWKLKTDTEGKVKLDEAYKVSGSAFYLDASGKPAFPLGTVTIQETKAPKGYLINTEIIVRKITATGNQETLFVYNAPVIKDEVMRGDIQLTKFAEDSDTEVEKKVPLEGIKFKLTSKTTGKSWNIVTDKNGFASTKSLKISDHGNLPYDTYVISETNTPKEYKKIEDFEVTIAEDNQTLSYIIENKLILSPVKLIKKDTVTGNIIPIADAEFQLLDQDKKVITMHTYYPKKEEISTFKTDATGTFMLPEKLKVGTYYFHELTAPDGYLKGEDVGFEITEGHNWEKPFVVEFFNQPVKGRIEVLKKDEETGEVLSGARFEITAAEEILSGDGTLIADAGMVIDTIETGADGRAASENLYLGKYDVQEVQSPDGYLLSDTKYRVNLEYEDQTVPVIVETLEIENKPTKIKLIKADKESGELLGDVTFKVWNKEAGEETATEYTTNQEGLIEIERLVPGTYCIQEKQTLPGYVLDTSIYEIMISEDGRIDGKETGVLKLTNLATVIIGTKARDEIGTVRKEMEQIDEVTIKNLQIGQSYLLKGIIMDKETKRPLLINGNTVTAEKRFVASKKDMTVEVTFQYDGSTLYGKKIVCFEKLYVESGNELIEISSHEDLDDEKQTIIYKEKTPSKEKPPKKTSEEETKKPENIQKETPSVKTGDTGNLWMLLAVMTVSGGYIISRFLKKKKK